MGFLGGGEQLKSTSKKKLRERIRHILDIKCEKI